MKKIAILVSPLAKGAYFNDVVDVAEKELRLVSPHIEIEHRLIGEMLFFLVNIESSKIIDITRLSFVQGVFDIEGELFRPIALENPFSLHADFVFGSKFKGKTNELLTQFLINIGLHFVDKPTSEIKLLDPMCGRGTTLMWAMRYGIRSKGIEQDVKAIPEVRQIIKKWTKIHRQKHSLKEGFIGKKNKQNKGLFIDFVANETQTRIINGDAREANQILKNEKFHLLVSDIPYGVQHFTTENTRNPLSVLAECAPSWSQCLHTGGVLVLAFNRYIPKRQALIDVFTPHELEVIDFSASHRMSESIVRDIVVLRKVKSKS